MDILTVAQAVGPLLAPFIGKAMEGAANKTGEMGAEKAGALLDTICGKFGADQDDYAAQTLQRFEEQPNVASRQETLATLLAEMAEADPAFADALTYHVEDMARDTGVSQFLTQVYGDARVGKITNIASARDVHF